MVNIKYIYLLSKFQTEMHFYDDLNWDIIENIRYPLIKRSRTQFSDIDELNNVSQFGSERVVDSAYIFDRVVHRECVVRTSKNTRFSTWD